MVVHAEQSAINNAWLNGAQAVLKIAISDAPCGYCRQFMNELSTADSLEILLPERDFNLHELLPYSFGPKDLGNEAVYFLISKARNSLLIFRLMMLNLFNWQSMHTYLTQVTLVRLN